LLASALQKKELPNLGKLTFVGLLSGNKEYNLPHALACCVREETDAAGKDK
jgi:hypothetical protein